MAQHKSYILTNDFGMRVEIINFGARIKSILFPVNDKPTEMIVAYPDQETYLNDPFYLGATCGRVSNRINKASFELDGTQFKVSENEGNNCLHGGKENFALCFWQEKPELSQTNEVTLYLISSDGDQGFPGRVEIQVRYHLSNDNKLTMSYSASTNKATPLNITNHSYFNLGETDCLGLALQIDSNSYLEVDESSIPTGAILPVENSDFCFNTEARIGEKQNQAGHPQIMAPLGYDHCYILNKQKNETNASAVLKSYRNKVKMSLHTDQPALQLYTGSFLADPFDAYQGVCLEAQSYIDALNNSNFPNNILRPENKYEQTIMFHFEGF